MGGFMQLSDEEPVNRGELLLSVMEQIQTDVYENEYSLLYDLLDLISSDALKSFLKQAEHYEKLRWN